MNTQDWNGCYDGSWQSAPLVAEAYAHPAKVSFNLAERIYRHMLAEGWLTPGDAVLDPFGGIGGFAFHAALYGMHWTGVELEQRFVDLGRQNLDLWRNRYAPHFPAYGTARLLQGDSRRLIDVVLEARHSLPAGRGNMAMGIVSSPPYADQAVTSGNVGNAMMNESWGTGTDLAKGRRDYGTTPGQLGAMPAGVVSSPPYADGAQHTGGDTRMTSGRGGPIAFVDYGTTPGQLGNDTADTFWSAAAAIVAQCYAILRPGGYAAWVTGDFVRNRQRVPFGQQWLDLCVSCGFEPVLWAVAWKTEHNGTQAGLFGEAREMRREKVSFFRRLANQKNPDAAIANEDVIFVRRPL